MKLSETFDYTQGNLQDYIDCCYRFYLRYVLRTKWPALRVEDAVDFEQRGQTGARFHRMIQQYLLGVPEARLQDLAAADPDPQIALWWDDFLQYVPALLAGQPFVETALSTTLNGHRLLSKYDLVLLQANGQLAIFDWKTSQKQPRVDWLLNRVQTRLYRFVLTEAAENLEGGKNTSPEQVIMYYSFAPHPQAPVSLPYTTKDYDADRIYFTNLVGEILEKPKEDFIKTSDIQKCRYCVYRSHCDRGTAAGDIEGFEVFEMEPEDFEQELQFDEIEEIAF